MKHFTTITTNIKKHIQYLNIDSPLVCIVGEEGSYKSSIYQSMHLALTGKVPGVPNLPQELVKLSADPEEGLDVVLAGPESTASYRLYVDKHGKAKRPEPPLFEGALAKLTEEQRYCILPSVAANDFFDSSKGERKIREALIRRFGDSKSQQLQTPEYLSEAQAQLWEASVGEAKTDLDASASSDELLSHLTAYFRSTSLALRKEITKLEGFIAKGKTDLKREKDEKQIAPEMLSGLQARLASELAKIEAQKTEAAVNTEQEKHAAIQSLSKAEAELEQQRKLKTELISDLASHKKSLAQLELSSQTSRANLEKQLEQVRSDFASVESDLSFARDDLEPLIAKLHSSQIAVKAFTNETVNHKGFCPYCASVLSAEDAAELKAIFTERVEKRQSEIAELSSKVHELETRLDALRGLKAEAATELSSFISVNSAKVQVFNTLISELTQELETCEEDIKVLQVHRDFQEAELAKLSTVDSEPPTSSTLAQALHSNPYTVVEALKTEISQIETWTAAKAKLVAQEKQVRAEETRYEDLKVLEKEATQMQRDVMETVAQTAAMEISACLPGNRQCSIDPETCAFSVTDSEGVFRPLSTACQTEKTALKLGFMAAWTRGAPLRMALFDDVDMVGLSAKGMRDFFKACEEAVDRGDFTQVVLVWNRPDEVPSTVNGGRWHTIVTKKPAELPA